MLWAVFLFFHFVLSYQCKFENSMDPYAHSLKPSWAFICYDENLWSLPTDINPLTEYLSLGRNNLASIDSAYLESLSLPLTGINLKQNSLTTFPNLTFYRSTMIEILLQANGLVEVDLSLLATYPLLTVMDLTNNQISILRPLQAGETLPHLEMFYIGSNSLTVLPDMCHTPYSDVSLAHSSGLFMLQIDLISNSIPCDACVSWLKTCPYYIDQDYRLECSWESPNGLAWKHLSTQVEAGSLINTGDCRNELLDNVQKVLYRKEATLHYAAAVEEPTTVYPVINRIHCASIASANNAVSFTFQDNTCQFYISFLKGTYDKYHSPD